MTEEVYLVLKPSLPRDTYMSSAFRDAAYQLRVIKEKARLWNNKNPRKSVPIPSHMDVEKPSTWAPTLIALRNYSVAVNAPYNTTFNKVNLPVTPHGKMRAVFDLSHPEQTSEKMQEILDCCREAERKGLLVYSQLKLETNDVQLAVHVDVKYVSSLALYRVRCQIGWIG